MELNRECTTGIRPFTTDLAQQMIHTRIQVGRCGAGVVELSLSTVVPEMPRLIDRL